MKIDDLIKPGLFEKNWLGFTSDQELKIFPKDPIHVRWFKFLIQALFCCYCDVYGHIRINRVAAGIWVYFQKEPKKDLSCKEKYITLIKNILDSELDRRPIKTHRQKLKNLLEKINKYNLPNVPSKK